MHSSNFVIPKPNEQQHSFGMLLTGRNWEVGGQYRYGFDGKEQDDELYGNGNEYDYGFRIYNPCLGRFLSVDPLFQSYPWFTPYQFAGNRPIWCIDLDGCENRPSTKKSTIYEITEIYDKDGTLLNGTFTLGNKSFTSGIVTKQVGRDVDGIITYTIKVYPYQWKRGTGFSVYQKTRDIEFYQEPTPIAMIGIESISGSLSDIKPDLDPIVPKPIPVLDHPDESTIRRSITVPGGSPVILATPPPPKIGPIEASVKGISTHFESGRDILENANYVHLQLDKLVNELGDSKDYHITIYGNVNSDAHWEDRCHGCYGYTWGDLAINRAEIITDYLVDIKKLDPSRISTETGTMKPDESFQSVGLKVTGTKSEEK